MITIVSSPDVAAVTRQQDLLVFVTANAPALQRAIVVIYYAGLGTSELVYTGRVFKPSYTGSRAAPYSDMSGTGLQMVIRRDGGWPDNPLVRVVAYDVAGGEATFSGGGPNWWD